MSEIEKSNYLEISNKANKILEIFDESEVIINHSSYLFKLLTNTIENFSKDNTPFEIFDALCVNRLYDAILYINNAKNKKNIYEIF